MIQASWFDLDGTLLDTAPDMIAVLDQLLAEESREPLDYATGRAHVSNGALGLIDLAFGAPDAALPLIPRARYLELYSNHLATVSTPYAG